MGMILPPGYLELSRKLIAFEEGRENEAYQDDTHKIWHVGIGHNLEIDQTPEEIAIIGHFTDPSKVVLTDDQIDALFAEDVRDALEELEPVLSKEDIDNMGEGRFAAILSMFFQMGGSGVRKFKVFLQAVRDGDWEKAAHEMVTGSQGGPSLWLKQTEDRCRRAAEAMRHGYFAMFQTPIPKSEDAGTVTEVYDFKNATDREILELMNELSVEILKRYLA